MSKRNTTNPSDETIASLPASRSPNGQDLELSQRTLDEWALWDVFAPRMNRFVIDQVSNDWNTIYHRSKNSHRSSSSTNNTTGAQIKLLLSDDADNDENPMIFDIGASTTLKSLFKNYADKRGISLRSLRFSHAGKNLFLSSSGNKTPDMLGLRDGDVIAVHCVSHTQESRDDSNSSSQKNTRTPSSSIKKKTRTKRSKKSISTRDLPQERTAAKTLEDYKIEHSKLLTKIHEEAQSKFSQIRRRLNNLAIERSQPKAKSRWQRTSKNETPFFQSTVRNPLNDGIGGKAGKAHYVVQVGEVQNLYKTAKQSALSQHSSSPLPTLDLHGYTKEEALAKLDSNLSVWVDAAMKGSYPFVRQAVIVCGCGNQILSETVQHWIRSNRKVCNAPKIWRG